MTSLVLDSVLTHAAGSAVLTLVAYDVGTEEMLVEQASEVSPGNVAAFILKAAQHWRGQGRTVSQLETDSSFAFASDAVLSMCCRLAITVVHGGPRPSRGRAQLERLVRVRGLREYA